MQDKYKMKLCRFADLVASNVEVDIIDNNTTFSASIQSAVSYWSNDIGLVLDQINSALDILEDVWEWGPQLKTWREEHAKCS